MTIVKVQVPLWSIGRATPASECMVYAEGRKQQVIQEVSGDTLKAIGKDKKAFFEAEWKGGAWQIGKRVEDREW